MNIFCKFSQMVPVAALKEHPKNAARHDIMQVSLLADAIRLNGWRKPIVVSTLSGCIVKGHCRLAAAKKLGATEVPVEYQTYATEADELADMLADNRIAEFAEVDQDALNAALATLRESDFPMLAAGFRDADFLPAAPAESNNSAPAELAALIQKGVIGCYQFKYTIDEQNAWLEGIYAAVGRQEADVIAEIRRRLGL